MLSCLSATSIAMLHGFMSVICLSVCRGILGGLSMTHLMRLVVCDVLYDI